MYIIISGPETRICNKFIQGHFTKQNWLPYKPEIKIFCILVFK